MSDNEVFQAPRWYSQDEVNKIREECAANLTRVADRLSNDHATQWANKAIEDMKESYEAELAAVRTRCEGLENALQPFADAVYNDNGDIEVNLSVNSDDLIRAYFTLRRATLYAIKD